MVSSHRVDLSEPHLQRRLFGLRRLILPSAVTTEGDGGTCLDALPLAGAVWRPAASVARRPKPVRRFAVRPRRRSLWMLGRWPPFNLDALGGISVCRYPSSDVIGDGQPPLEAGMRQCGLKCRPLSRTSPWGTQWGQLDGGVDGRTGSRPPCGPPPGASHPGHLLNSARPKR